MTRIAWIPGLLTIAANSLLAQPSGTSGPISGFLFDNSAHALRPIQGLPGSSYAGDPVNLGFPLAYAAVAPRQDSAVVVAADSSVHLFRFSAASPSERPCDGLSVVPESVTFSPSGASAALYAGGRAQIVTGLPDSLVLAGTVDLTAASATFSISDDGAYLLFVAGGSVRLLGIGGESRKVMDVADGAIAAFAPSSHDAAVADPAGAGVVLIRDLTGSSAQSVLAPPGDSIASATGIAFSADANQVFVASSSARSVAVFDLQSGASSTVPCPCSPTGIVRMGNVFRLNEPGPAPLWLLDPGAGNPRTVFVPALQAAAAN